MATTVAREFFRLAFTAARNGGFWVSAGGGTARVVAGEIARSAGISFEDAWRALDQEGSQFADKYGPALYGHSGPFNWYELLSDIQPFRPDNLDAAADARFDARTIARAAVRAARASGSAA